MNTRKKVALGISVVGVVVSAQAAFFSGTAEAHCGHHSDTCADQGAAMPTSQYCVDSTHVAHVYDQYSGYCTTPAPGCSGMACADWPCADESCELGTTHDCFESSITVTLNQICTSCLEEIHNADPEGDQSHNRYDTHDLPTGMGDCQARFNTSVIAYCQGWGDSDQHPWEAYDIYYSPTGHGEMIGGYCQDGGVYFSWGYSF